MGLGGVTLVLGPAVLGVLLGQAVHVVVAVGLGENARRRYRQILAVALDDGRIWNEAVGLEAVAVNDDGLGAERQLVEGAVHGQYAGVEDVDLVDFLGRHHAHGPRQGVALNLAAQLVTATGRELLRVVEGVVNVVFGQDYRRGIHAAGKAAPPRLVASGLYEACVHVALKHFFLVFLFDYRPNQADKTNGTDGP